MAVINFANREISCKIVYFGAPGAGCNTNVRHLHASLKGGAGALHRFAPPDSSEATWFFAYDPPADPIQGFHIRYRVYSLPGGISDAAHRKEVLREVDGVIFVADARDASLPGNEAALLDLEAALADQDIELAGLPVVLQVNHTDAASSADVGRVTRPLNAYGFPVQRCAAKSGVGVQEAFEASLRATRVGLSDTFSGTTRSIKLRAQYRDGDEAPLRSLLKGAPAVPTVAVQPTEYLKPEEEIELPFQPKAFTGTHPVRILDTTIEDGQVIVDLELQRMGGGATRGLRVRLANRPTDQPPASSTAVHSLSPVVAAPVSPIIGITDHLPDKIEFNRQDASHRTMPPLWYGIAGLLGGVLGGVLIGFLIFH